MESERSDGDEGGGQEVGDEFACAGMLRGSLSSLHSSVERIFRVAFGIGADDLPHNNGQIWLRMRGPSNNVKAAKLFVKGVVNQEQQQEVSYPGALHCVFCGSRGLFRDCLIKTTSAQIVVGSPGFLLVSGLTEPVVRAYSIITDLVERYEGSQTLRTEIGEKGPGESLDSRRAFKCLVEKWEDRHILDLLVLPWMVKEVLLDLVKESGLGSGPTLKRNTEAILDGESESRWDPGHSNRTDRQVDVNTVVPGKDAAAKDTFLHPSSPSPMAQRWAEGSEERWVHSPQEVGAEGQPEQVGTLQIQEEEVEEEEEELLLSVGTKKEFRLLLKFFTAMGYTENVVKRVLARTGPKEASQILDLIQQEQDCSDRQQRELDWTGPCETEHKDGEETVGTGREETVRNLVRELQEAQAEGSTKDFEDKGSAAVKEGVNEEDFVLGVVKKAAASCGYTEEKVAEVYSMLPDLSTRQLLLKLQQEGTREPECHQNDVMRVGPREVDDEVPQMEVRRSGATEGERRRGNELSDQLFIPEDKMETCIPAAEPDLFPWVSQLSTSDYASKSKQNQPTESHTPNQTTLSEIRGPPLTMFPSPQDIPYTNFQPPKQASQTYATSLSTQFTNTPKQKLSSYNNAPKPHFQPEQPLKHAYEGAAHNFLEPQRRYGSDLTPTRGKEGQGFPSSSSGVVVTGEQRFLEGLQTPFDLKLTDKPVDPKLRMIIIDGSNVAMSHGLGQFFSCRGIALAVQHFWDRGHRRITTFLPQWRQKSDTRIKEQHYLADLQQLGLLSYTPSREVQGKRISSYDDRFMLRLAQESDGIIVTNDNLRDLLDESHVWRDIIKKRLLQYTFVGDHFMVPDDPLGRGGPHLDDFLRSGHRPPNPGNHSFAGLASRFPFFKAPRSQTEVLNYRDRTLGAATDQVAGVTWGKGQDMRWDMGHAGVGHQQRQKGSGNSRPGHSTGRSPEETAGLRECLYQVFPGQDSMVTLVLQSHPAETDINVLSDLILEQQLG
ncbi:protein KHNYN [Genypterus blacodes]|uniref:protein KHNYN n=1 Tax=Genypterus blacodes TaxID=154954 RepID=UPI003F762598